MVYKSPTSKRLKAEPGRQRSATSAEATSTRSPTNRSGGKTAEYLRKIEELEHKVSEWRTRCATLRLEIASAHDTRTHFAELFENAPIGYVVHDRNGFISQMNKAAHGLLSLRPARLGCFSQFFGREQLRTWLEHMRLCIKEGRASSELLFRVDNERTLPIQIVTVLVATHDPTKTAEEFRSMLIDLSRRRAAEAALARTQQDYHRLIDTIEGIVWEADVNSMQITFVSRYAQRLLGYSLEEWHRPGFWLNRIYVDDRDRISNEVARAVAARKETVLEYRVTTADRQVIWLHDSVAPVQREGRLRLLGVAIDVSDRRLAEQQLRNAHETLEQRVQERTIELREKVTDLETFSYTLSHDMRSPIRAIEGYATLLERFACGKLNEKEKDFLVRIRKSAQRLDLLVRDVLNYTRISQSRLELKPVPLEGVLRSILSDYPELAPPRAEVQVKQPLPVIYGHEGFIGQAITNLLNNAVKFMPEGKKPKVKVWVEEAGTTTFIRKTGEGGGAKAISEQEWVRICVEDNGVGIAPEDQKRIFRLFERIHPVEEYEGTGIGLAIVQKAVERMGGRLGVHSTPGTGSRFWIELRRARD